MLTTIIWIVLIIIAILLFFWLVKNVLKAVVFVITIGVILIAITFVFIGPATNTMQKYVEGPKYVQYIYEEESLIAVPTSQDFIYPTPPLEEGENATKTAVFSINDTFLEDIEVDMQNLNLVLEEDAIKSILRANNYPEQYQEYADDYDSYTDFKSMILINTVNSKIEGKEKYEIKEMIIENEIDMKPEPLTFKVVRLYPKFVRGLFY